MFSLVSIFKVEERGKERGGEGEEGMRASQGKAKRNDWEGRPDLRRSPYFDRAKSSRRVRAHKRTQLRHAPIFPRRIPRTQRSRVSRLCAALDMYALKISTTHNIPSDATERGDAWPRFQMTFFSRRPAVRVRRIFREIQITSDPCVRPRRYTS